MAGVIARRGRPEQGAPGRPDDARGESIYGTPIESLREESLRDTHEKCSQTQMLACAAVDPEPWVSSIPQCNSSIPPLTQFLRFIVLDELGYLPFAQAGGQLLFHLVSQLYGLDPRVGFFYWSLKPGPVQRASRCPWQSA